MANIKSAKKRILQSSKRSEINKKRRSMLRSKIKNLNYSVENKNKAEAKKMFVDLEPALSKSVNSGLFKKNTVSRTLSRLSKKIKLLN
ncbi:MAG: 30S ribosomal protein S20 [Rickettsiales bacterium]|nr:30S ribosomal protein S20 [Rickettsiales bacterium]OUW72272.1 MAG: 30S ribosomal protein S20 [Rickettsiales bacterium TMED211]